MVGGGRWFSREPSLPGAVLAARAMGADLAYIGSAFIATRQANAPDAYKQMIVDSNTPTSFTAITSPACTATT